MEEAEEKLAQKRAFYKQFDEIQRLDDEPEDRPHDEAAFILKSSRKVKSSHSPSRSRCHVSQLDPPLARTQSAPGPRTTALLSSKPDAFKDQASLRPVLPEQKGGAIRDNTTSTETTAMPASRSRAISKRKREQSPELKPESQQIFRGLRFYFFPDNDVAPARRFRIRKAHEWGAVWLKQWAGDATHIIVDNGLKYKDLLSYLKVSSLPPGIIIVNEQWPASCITFRDLIDHEQDRYQVDGYRKALVTERSLPATSSGSLPLKQPNVRDAQPAESPSRTEESGPIASLEDPNFISAQMDSGEVDQPKSAERPRNALEKSIEEAKSLNGIPLDIEEEDVGSNNTSADDSDVELSEEEPSKLKKTRTRPFDISERDKTFSCMHKNDGIGKTTNPNARTVEILQQMLDYYERIQDPWRTIAYRKAITGLRRQSKRIMNKEEALAIPSIGERLATKIEEIVWTDRFRRLEYTTLEPHYETLQLFLKVYGVGHSQAIKWINQGFHTLDDLSSRAHLTKAQEIGLAHYADFQTRIPRAEVEQHGRIVRDAIAAVDPDIQVTIGGSYRRGASSSGDVDFIITKPDTPLLVLNTLMLDTIIPNLFSSRYLRAGLAVTSDASTGSKWHGAACLPGKEGVWRRVDFLFVPWDEMGAALIYFTGNDLFNRSIRLLASKRGMRLNQRGLWKDVVRGPRRERITQGSLVEGKSEKRIFEVLGVPWRRPEERIV